MAKGVQLKGAGNTAKLLQALARNLQEKELRAVVRKGAKVIQDEARQNALSIGDSGEVAKSIGIIENPDDPTGVIVTARRGKRYPRGYIAHILEYGSAPHIIRPKNGQKLAFEGAVVKEVQHPGIKPQPFMRPAWDTKQQEALEKIKQGLATLIFKKQ